MKRESKKPQDQQDDRNSPEHGLTLLFETRFVQVIFLTLSLGQAYTGRWRVYRRIGVSASGEVKAAFRDRYNVQEVSKELMILRKRRHADTFPQPAHFQRRGPVGCFSVRRPPGDITIICERHSSDRPTTSLWSKCNFGRILRYR
jgi:hypothetical protein